ncbi:MAG: hypothetical protein EP322_03690 [Bacteroidetes bacterium]|nr:MAG: hypothetical protein EP322_03690 [Bacteroidota bacterium]
MNDAHLHLLVNHFPIITPILGLIILITGFIFRSEVTKRIAYFLFVIGAITTLPAFSSGEGAEEVLEHMGANHRLIHEHEEVAETFALLSYILGALSLLSLVASWKKMKMAAISGYAVMLLALLVIYMGRQTGTTGGEIKHDEIRSGNQVENDHDDHDDHESDEDDDH